MAVHVDAVIGFGKGGCRLSVQRACVAGLMLQRKPSLSGGDVAGCGLTAIGAIIGVPEMGLLPGMQRQQFVMAACLEQAGERQRPCWDVNETLMIGPGGLNHIEVPFGMQVHQGGESGNLTEAMRDR